MPANDKYRKLFETMASMEWFTRMPEEKSFRQTHQRNGFWDFRHGPDAGRTSMDPNWQTTREDGRLLSGKDHPSHGGSRNRLNRCLVSLWGCDGI